MKKMIGLTALALIMTAGSAIAQELRERPHHPADTDGSGSVSRAEFISHQEEKFTKMDKDGSGDISQEEAKEARKAHHEKMKERRENRAERRAEREAAASE